MTEVKDNMQVMTDDAWQMVSGWCSQGFDPLEIAAVLSNAGMRMYRTTLDDRDFNLIIDHMSENRNLVRKMKPTFN